MQNREGLPHGVVFAGRSPKRRDGSTKSIGPCPPISQDTMRNERIRYCPQMPPHQCTYQRAAHAVQTPEAWASLRSEMRPFSIRLPDLEIRLCFLVVAH